MKWTFEDIIKAIFTGGLFTLITGVVAKKMDWIRFSKKDTAQVGKVESEIAIDRAEVAQKKIADEVKISDAALQWTVNLASQLEKANMMIDKKQTENERLHGIIDTMKKDFERDFEKLRADFEIRVQQLEDELEKSQNELKLERQANRTEIETLKKQINARK